MNVGRGTLNVTESNSNVSRGNAIVKKPLLQINPK